MSDPKPLQGRYILDKPFQPPAWAFRYPLIWNRGAQPAWRLVEPIAGLIYVVGFFLYCAAILVLGVGIFFGSLYVLVRFVRWAWNS